MWHSYLNISDTRSKVWLRKITHKPQNCHPHSHSSLHGRYISKQTYYILHKGQRSRNWSSINNSYSKVCCHSQSDAGFYYVGHHNFNQSCWHLLRLQKRQISINIKQFATTVNIISIVTMRNKRPRYKQQRWLIHKR